MIMFVDYLCYEESSLSFTTNVYLCVHIYIYINNEVPLNCANLAMLYVPKSVYWVVYASCDAKCNAPNLCLMFHGTPSLLFIYHDSMSQIVVTSE